MSGDVGSLSVAAVTIGFIHCVSGPDHYVPFVAMSRVGLWSMRKTLLITFLCGIGHVASSAVLGCIGVALGVIVLQLEEFESMRGDLAAWLFLVFGFGYFVWGVVHALRTPKTKQLPSEKEVIDDAESTATSWARRTGKYTPWILFTIFVFGPCEPLIPLLIIPAAEASVGTVILITSLFAITTLVTMIALVYIIHRSTVFVRFQRYQKYGHAVAGLIVLACGAAILLGL